MNHRLLKYLFFCFSLILSSCESSNDKSKTNLTGRPSSESQLVKAEGKKPMILLTDRPYNLETPLSYFLEDFTPNDVFFVRWHLSNLPLAVNPDTFHLRIGGHVANKLALTLNDLKTKFKTVTMPALCVCSGNARSLFKPAVAGAQWVNGGMGNARWTGVKLKDILEMAQIKPKAAFIAFGGMDAPPLPSIPDFIKTLDIKHAMDGEVMIAYEMNGAPIPYLNGYPLKLVVPGWYATYWVGMLNDIEVFSDSIKTYWMDKAYLVPKVAADGNEKPDSLATQMKPVTKIFVRSVFVSPEPNTSIPSGKPCEIQGLAFDGGDGISKVEISLTNGESWQVARLDPSLGNYSWRRWRYTLQPEITGNLKIYVKATNATGQTQPWHQWNRSGYMRNEIESLELNVK